MLEAQMVCVKYDHTMKPIQGILPVKKVLKSEKIKYDNTHACWIAFNYFRDGETRDFGQIAFRLLQMESEGVTVCFRKPNGEYEVPLYYDETSGLWFERAHFENPKKDGEYKYKGFINGFAHSGMINVIVKHQDVVVLTQNVFFHASGISIEDFDEMITDLYRINESLVRGKATETSAAKVKERTARSMWDFLERIEAPLRSISNNPDRELSYRFGNIRLGEGKNFNLKHELMLQMFPGKTNSFGMKLIGHNDIFEHQLLCQVLHSLKVYCNCFGKAATTDRLALKSELSEIYGASDSVVKQNIDGESRKGDVKNLLDVNYGLLMDSIDDKISEEIEDKKRCLSNALQEHQSKNYSQNSVEMVIDLNIVPECRIIWNEKEDWNEKEGGIFRAGYRENNKMKQLIQYSYENNTPSLKSKFYEIQNQASDARSQLWLFKAFVEAREIASNSPNGYSRMKITAKVIKNKLNDVDVIGEVGKSEYKDYCFRLVEIRSIIIDHQIFPFELHEKEALESLVDEISPKNIFENVFARAVIGRMRDVSDRFKGTTDDADLYVRCEEKIEELLRLPIFKGITMTKGLPLIPTPLFRHEPVYQMIWSAIGSLVAIVGISATNFDYRESFGVEKVEKIYQYWCLYKMINLLCGEGGMGWKLENGENIYQLLEDYINYTGKSNLYNFKAVMSMGEWKVELFHEGEIETKTKHPNGAFKKVRPDYLLRFYYKNEPKGNVFLDAKHKNYLEQPKDSLEKELLKVAITNYGKQRFRDLDGGTIASFLMHTDVKTGLEKERSGENYHAYYNCNINPEYLNGGKDEAHKYGAIYMLPSITWPFRKWFGMLMEYRLGKYETCWHCGCDDIQKEIKYTVGGFKKFHYTCKTCGEFWVKNHCGHQSGHHTLIKHFNNYHKQVERDHSWYVVCPVCKDGDINPN